jgi:hypothetical protein
MRQRRSRSLRIPIALGFVLVAALGIEAFSQIAGQKFGGEAQTLACSPQPCLNLQNFTLWVTDVTDQQGVLRMQVRFRNSSDASHASPEDLQLVDSTNQTAPSIQEAPGCTHWSRTEFNNGASYGPITVCFRPGSTKPPLTLRWSPDLGLICCRADLKIR